MALLIKMDPLLIALNMIFLGVVILVPCPTNLIGNDPQARAALINVYGMGLLTTLERHWL